MADRMNLCPICGGPKTIANAEICGRCKIAVNTIELALEKEYVRTHKKEFFEQAKNVLKARFIQRDQKNIRDRYDRNSAGFVHE